MQSDQVKGMFDRAVAVLATMFLTWLVNRGVMGQSDAAQLLPAIVLFPSLAWGWWNNRAKALVQSAASVPGTVVITTPALAGDTPERNIVSSTLPPNALADAVTKQAATEAPK